MALGTKSRTRAQVSIRNREEFHVSNLRGTHWFAGYGRMQDPEYSKLRDVRERVTYFVYSYGTPIAWFVDGEWVVPNVGYSATTRRNHLPVVKDATR